MALRPDQLVEPRGSAIRVHVDHQLVERAPHRAAHARDHFEAFAQPGFAALYALVVDRITASMGSISDRAAKRADRIGRPIGVGQRPRHVEHGLGVVPFAQQAGAVGATDRVAPVLAIERLHRLGVLGPVVDHQHKPFLARLAFEPSVWLARPLLVLASCFAHGSPLSTTPAARASISFRPSALMRRPEPGQRDTAAARTNPSSNATAGTGSPAPSWSGAAAH